MEETELTQPPATGEPEAASDDVGSGDGGGAAAGVATATKKGNLTGTVGATSDAVPVGRLVEWGSPLPAPGIGVVDTGTVVAIVVSVVGLGLVLWLRSRMSTGGAVRPVPAPAWRATGSDALDARAAALGALIREADARIAELTALRDELSELRAGPDRSTEPYVGDAFAPRRSVSAARPGVVGGGRAGGLVCSDPVADRVYELADSGRSPVEIAGALQEHTGKVELILALRRSATAARV